MSPTASEDDLLIGQTVATLRGNRSQQWVADRMRAQNPRWRWSQATLWAIEKGERPLRLAEARDLATVLGVKVMDILERHPEVPERVEELKRLIASTRTQVKAMEVRVAQAEHATAEAAERVNVAMNAHTDARGQVEVARVMLHRLTSKLDALVQMLGDNFHE